MSIFALCFQSGSTATSLTTPSQRTPIAPLTSCLTPGIHFSSYAQGAAVRATCQQILDPMEGLTSNRRCYLA